MLGIILIVVLVLLLVGGLPSMPYWQSMNVGYGPSGAIGVVLIIVLVLLLIGRI